MWKPSAFEHGMMEYYRGNPIKPDPVPDWLTEEGLEEFAEGWTHASESGTPNGKN